MDFIKVADILSKGISTLPFSFNLQMEYWSFRCSFYMQNELDKFLRFSFSNFRVWYATMKLEKFFSKKKKNKKKLIFPYIKN